MPDAAAQLAHSATAGIARQPALAQTQFSSFNPATRSNTRRLLLTIFILETASSLQSFVDQGWEFGATGALSAAADKQGAMFTGAVSVSVSPRVFIYQITGSPTIGRTGVINAKGMP